MAEDNGHSQIDITFAPSLRCNMHCDYCFQNEIRAHGETGVIDRNGIDSTIEFIKKQANRNNVETLNLIWFGGEPLLNVELLKDFTKRLKQSLLASVKLNTKIITNSILLTPSLLHLLIAECDLKSVQISIDGGKERYSKTRGISADLFDRVIDNVIMCSESIETIVRLNISPVNISELFQFIKDISSRIKNKNNIRFKISEIINYSRNNKLSIPVFQPGDFRRIYRKFSIYIKQMGFNIECYYIEKFYPIGCKYFLPNNYAIDPYGNLYKCEHHFGEGAYIVGTVEDGLVELEKKLHIYSNDNIDHRCTECNIYPLCKYATCLDYRQFMGNNQKQCNCYELQYKILQADIRDNISNFPITDIEP